MMHKLYLNYVENLSYLVANATTNPLYTHTSILAGSIVLYFAIDIPINVIIVHG